MTNNNKKGKALWPLYNFSLISVQVTQILSKTSEDHQLLLFQKGFLVFSNFPLSGRGARPYSLSPHLFIKHRQFLVLLTRLYYLLRKNLKI